MNDPNHWLETATRAALEAGELLKDSWRKVHKTRDKGYRDIVTETDIASETIIVDKLRAAYPNHAITSEEAGADSAQQRIRWVIDPIDGTTNFSRNNPNFCISIAAIDTGVPVIGVIHDALRDHLFTACKGSGAFLNGSPIHTSEVTTIEAALCAADWGRDTETRKATWKQIEALFYHARTLRALGSAALNMAYVAAGWVDLYLSLHLYPWDQAAAGLIVQEAGGTVATISGQAWSPEIPDPLFAATPALIQDFHTIASGVENEHR